VDLNRRDLLRRLGGLTIAPALIEQTLAPLNLKAAGKVTPRGTARNVIFIALNGAISQVDCWDFKETRFTPADLNVSEVSKGLYLSKTLFPSAAEWAPKTSLVRSMKGTELVHFVGQYHLQVGRPLNPAVGKEIPAFGTVIASELESQRQNSDTFPTYMSLSLAKNRVGAIGSGFFPARHTGVDIDSAAMFEVFGGASSSSSNDVLERRYEALKVLSEESPTGIGQKQDEYRAYYSTAFKVLDDKRWWKLFQTPEARRKEYGNELGINCMLARDILAADAGCRFVYISDNTNWDSHAYIFDHSRAVSHYTQCLSFDKAYTRLLNDLESTPGHTKGKTLLDETMVVVTSEFGRVPYMNNVAGRDHYDQTFTSMFAGGGVKPGKLIGATDSDGSKCTDTGWNHKEQPHLDNIVATMYSALGIAWDKVIPNTPSGRGYYYVQTAPLGGSEFISDDAIDPLFTA
jgi:hypothetical protein